MQRESANNRSQRSARCAETQNPFCWLGFDRDDQRRIRVVSLRREQGWRTTVVDCETRPRLFELLAELLMSDGDLELDDDDDDSLDELRAIGMLVRADEVPDEVSFGAPPLDEPPTPDAAMTDGEASDGDEAGWIVNASLSWVPPSPSAGGHDALVWMKDARTGVTAPYVPGDLATALRACVAGRPAPPLDRATRERLRRAGVLVTPSEEAELEAARAAVFGAAACAFAANGYALVPELLPSAQLPALQRYYRRILDARYLRFGDGQVARRFAQHNEPIARLFLGALTDVVSHIAGEPVKPSYAYFASYRQGAVLARHRDRAQCAFSVSLLVDYAPAPHGPSPWPLWIGRTPDDAGTPLGQRIGDGIFYRGCELYHWRDALADAHESTHLFLHYVGRDFAGALE
jgi:hypothetical protein